MSIVGKGRIVVWEGASLWLVEGAQAVAELQPHAHHAIQITFRLRGGFEIGVAGACLTGPIAIVASDAPHSFRASGAVAFLFIAPESAAGRAIATALLAGRTEADVANGRIIAALDELRGCLEPGCTDAEIRQLGHRLLALLPAASAPALPDPRVLAMIDFARRNLDDTVALPAAAAAANLSPSRARHLFAAHTQLPFKTYVLWLRLERAVALYATGHSLTAAAHQAGFADSAHFSRTFKRTFGLPAAALRLSHG